MRFHASLPWGWVRFVLVSSCLFQLEFTQENERDCSFFSYKNISQLLKSLYLQLLSSKRYTLKTACRERVIVYCNLALTEIRKFRQVLGSVN